MTMKKKELPFSIQTITALVNVIIGDTDKWSYRRSISALQKFMGQCGIEYPDGAARMTEVRKILNRLNQTRDMKTLTQIIESAVDIPGLRGYRYKNDVVDSLNPLLRKDGYELVTDDGEYSLISTASYESVTDELNEKTEKYGLQAVKRDLKKALTKVVSDPDGAITAACSLVESTCKFILKDLGVKLPAKKDITSLVKETMNQLDLSPGRPDIDPDIRMMLSGLSTTAGGVGALRTHAGDAHGKDNDLEEIDSRVARFAVHAANTISLFLMDIWEKMLDESEDE